METPPKDSIKETTWTCYGEYNAIGALTRYPEELVAYKYVRKKVLAQAFAQAHSQEGLGMWVHAQPERHGFQILS